MLNATYSQHIPPSCFNRKEYNSLVDRGLPQALVVKHAYANVSIPYNECESLRSLATLEKIQYEKERMEKELSRQLTERSTLGDQFQRMEVEFSGAWRKKIRDLNEALDREKVNMMRVHEHQRHQLEENIQHIEASPASFPKYSPTVLEKMDREVALVKLQRYEEAREVAKDLNKQRQAEEEKFYAAQQRRFDKMRENLRKKQEDELKTLERKRHRAVKLLQWKRTESQKCLQQNFTNHRCDMDHAHKLEYIAPVQTDATLLWAHKSYQKSSSSFRGSQLKRRIDRGKALPLLNGLLVSPLEEWKQSRGQQYRKLSQSR
eukprot:Rmarinus@m.3472